MTTETPAEELKRLVNEYNTAHARDSTKEEAWNLIADFAVEHADAICAALARPSAATAEPAVAVKAEYPLETIAEHECTYCGDFDWDRHPCRSGGSHNWVPTGRQLHVHEARPLYAAPPPSPVVSEEMVDKALDTYIRGYDMWSDATRNAMRAALNAALSRAPAAEVGDAAISDALAAWHGTPVAHGDERPAMRNAIRTEARTGDTVWRFKLYASDVWTYTDRPLSPKELGPNGRQEQGHFPTGGDKP